MKAVAASARRAEFHLQEVLARATVNSVGDFSRLTKMQWFGYFNSPASKNTSAACQLMQISLLAYEANWSA